MLNPTLNHFHEWQQAFIAEWLRLAEGCADLLQMADTANELYQTHWASDPVEIAREEWLKPN